MAPVSANWDIFCRVIDNFGDIGVCWRLARQLAAEHSIPVRLWVDDLAALASLHTGVDRFARTQSVGGVAVNLWDDAPTLFRPGAVVIEAFACELPPGCMEAMASAPRPPAWINLEYLSAESWVEGCHGMASPHPRLPLVKHFFFPGFTAGTGGLLREANLLARRDAAQMAQPVREGLAVSLFCYETAPVAALVAALAASPCPVTLHVPEGKPLAAVSACFGNEAPPWRCGSLKVVPFAFLPQEGYDRLLWSCDVNFVRGEDSFVRAQWAGRPFVWQAYPQAESAHLDKLEAFLGRYCAGLAPAAAAVAVDLFRAWNSGGGESLLPLFEGFLEQRAGITTHARRWACDLAAMPDLASALVSFCRSRL